MNRLAGIIVAAIGFVTAILSITGVVPYLTQPGVVMLVLGGLMIGLSFIDRPDPEGEERMSTGSTLVNIFFSPSEVFRNLRRHPRWLAALLLMSLMSAVYGNLFVNRLTAERITNFAIDKTLEMPMIAGNEQARKQIEEGRVQAIEQAKHPVAQAGQAVSGFAMSFFGYAFLALVFFLFVMAMGGKINFWQAFSAAVYAAFPVNLLRNVVSSIILYLKDPADIHPILGAQTLVQDSLNFLVLPAEHPVIYTLLGAFGLLTLYWVWLNATGLKNAGERVSGTAAWSAAIGIFVLILFFGMAMAALFPGFIS